MNFSGFAEGCAITGRANPAGTSAAPAAVRTSRRFIGIPPPFRRILGTDPESASRSANHAKIRTNHMLERPIIAQADEDYLHRTRLGVLARRTAQAPG